ncbi:ATP-dependent DNA helicase-like protein [Phanerochaete sordida]|uniref:DNA 3'-5' helicase n=1 Tax=Phanerochaete sordida TaxID=48140 RepID=A0A9P3G8D1_9APHY|nr:ATP-dependent DNA helicase-like protein [Phanerochaete sordida]
MSENVPPSAIPLVSEESSNESEEEPLLHTLAARKVSILSTPRQSKRREPESVLTSSPKANSAKKRKQYRNGYEAIPKTPSYTPYGLRISSGRKRLLPFKFPDEDFGAVRRREPLSLDAWTALAREAGWIPQDGVMRDFQGHVSNLVLGQDGDIAVITPISKGKSLIWCFPLLVDKAAVPLVITPYTSLGIEGAMRMTKLKLPSVYIYEGLKSEDVLERAARGDFRVIFACPEMVESPRFARVLHCDSFKPLLQAVYLDEANSVYESHDWRPAYARISGPRRALGRKVPFVALSATLPSPYRAALSEYAGFREDHVLVNLRNFRPELPLVVAAFRSPLSDMNRARE